MNIDPAEWERLVRRVAQLERTQVRIIDAEVTEVDGTTAFTVAVPGEVRGRDLAGIAPASQHHVPEVGSTARLAKLGAQVLHQPGEIAENAIGTRELAESVVSDIDVALTTANGKNSVTHSLNDPFGDGTRAGDLWFKRDGAGVIVGAWEWDGDSWEARTFGSAVLESLDAGKITTGTLAAGVSITVGDDGQRHVLIGEAGVSAFVLDSDGQPAEVARFGETSGGIDPDTGLVTWYVGPEGIANFTGLNVSGEATVGGQLMSEVLAERSRIVAWTDEWSNPGATTTELGMIELSVETEPGHAYEIAADGMIADIAGADEATVTWRARYTTDGTAPTITSPVLASDSTITRYDLNPWENEQAHIRGLYIEGATSKTLRVGLSYVKPSNATNVQLWGDTWVKRIFTITDLGPAPGDTGQVNNMGGTSGSGTQPPPSQPKQEGELVYSALWQRVFTGGGSIWTEGANGAQGQSPYAPNGNMRTFLGFEDMTVELADAEIRYIKLWIYYNHWYYANGGYPIVSTHGHVSPPAGPTGQYLNGIVWNVYRIPPASGLWWELPTSWHASFKNGTFRGVVMGPGPNSSLDYYGKFDGAGAYMPKLAIGWRK